MRRFIFCSRNDPREQVAFEAGLYGVETRALNQAVKRNADRFPDDFMFKLTLEEAKAVLALRSQFVTLKRGEHLKYAPYVFTEHGAVMLANVLKSPVTVRASIQVARAFVRLQRSVYQRVDNLADLFAKSPFRGLDMDFERDKDTGRDIAL